MLGLEEGDGEFEWDCKANPGEMASVFWGDDTGPKDASDVAAGCVAHGLDKEFCHYFVTYWMD